jgi:hypothetical protein
MPAEQPTTLRRVLVARTLLLLAAAALAATGVHVFLRDGSAAAQATAGYSCPMHAEVFSSTPGQCPICKMALVSIDESKGNGATSTAEHPPDCPMHAKAVAPAVSPLAQSPEASSKPGAPLAAGVTWLPETHPPAAHAKPSDRPVLATPKRRVFIDDVRAPAWLETPERLSAVLYRDELVGLGSGDRGRFFRAASPRVPIDVRLAEEPPTIWDASSSLVRFVVEPRPIAPKEANGARDAASALRAGDIGWLEIEDKSRELLVFPESALLRSNEGPYVLVPGANERSFARRPVQIGRILKGQVVVLSGLRDDERIVVASAFFLDTERSREPDSAPIAGDLP